MLASEISLFVEQWKLIGYVPQTPSATVQHKSLIDPRKLDSLFTEMAPIMQSVELSRKQAFEQGSDINIFKVLGVGHDELKNSKMLAWLLDMYGSHGRGNLILKALIDKINKHKVNLINQQLIDAINCSTHYEIDIETYPDYANDSRIDIECDGNNFLLFIEVKIFAGETNNQLERYLEIAARKAGQRPWAVIYLTRYGTQPRIADANIIEKNKQCGHFLVASWSDITHILTQYINECPNFTHTTHSFRQFKQHIETFI